MAVNVRRTVIVLLITLGVGCDHPAPPSAPTPALVPVVSPTPAIRTFPEQKGEFSAAIAELGAQTFIDFEDIDARPLTDTIRGRTPFQGLRYASRGVTFANPNGMSLYIAPGGLPWNPTNSLSVGRFPFDSLDQRAEAPFIEDDDLIVSFDPACSAVAFSVIDKGAFSPDDFVQFLDSDGGLMERAAFPPTFLGIVSRVRAISRIVISEAGNDVDDVTYDDFVCVR